MRRYAAELVKRNPRLEYLYRRAVSLWPYAKRQSPDFWSFYSRLEQLQYASPEELRETQFEALMRTVRWAYQQSGFYRRLYDEHGVALDDIHSFDDFSRQIPVVDREMLQAANDLTVPAPKMSLAMTSGTSGSPFTFHVDPAVLAMDMAAIFHQWSRAGFRPGDPRVELRGVQTDAVRHFPDANVTRFSVINMNANIRVIVEELNRARIPYLHGYPSAVAKFASLLREHGLSLDHPIQGVFLASENVFPWQTSIIDEVIAPAAMIAHYGTAERTVLGSWCETRRTYHFIPLYGYLEQGASNEVISTGLLHRVTPFIRYRTTDVLLGASDEPCPACGRGYTPVVGGIAGRLEDHLVNERGELIPPAVVTFPFKNLTWIRSVQIIQREDRTLLLRCITVDGPAELVGQERVAVRQMLQRLLGGSIEVEFEEVAEIPLTSACKFKWIISEANGSRAS